jgi:choline dehydrogenase-like flavoprotein
MNANVFIVGAGPVGMTAASELARYGIPVRIVDKAPQRTDKSKALVIWSRTLELLDRGPGGIRILYCCGIQGAGSQHCREGWRTHGARHHGFGE